MSKRRRNSLGENLLSNLRTAKTAEERNFAKKLIDDAVHNSRSFFDTLSPSEQQAALTIFAELQESEGSSLTYDYLWELHYNEKPVPIWEFLDDKYYAGWLTPDMYPKWREVIEEVFSPGSQYMEVIFTGAIGSGKSSIAAIMYTYLIYRMSCLKNPAKYYELFEGSNIIFGVYSITQAQVKDVGYGRLRTILEHTPYFQQRFPFDQRILKRVKFKNTAMEVVHGSREFHVLGQDVFSMYLDEVNFMEDKTTRPNKGLDLKEEAGQAYELYNAARSRIKSRFMRPGGTVPGMTFLISSKTHQSAFLEKHIKRIRSEIEAKRVFVADFSRWEVQPASRFILPWFKVQIGDAILPSKILAEDEVPAIGTDVIEVPGEYKEEFTLSIERGLREVAGVSTTGVSPLFRDKTPVHDCIDKSRVHPFTKEIISISTQSEIEIVDYLINSYLFDIKDGELIARVNPSAPRAIHLDLALTGDRAGFAMGHISGMRKTKKMRADHTYYFDYEPEIVMDIVLAIELLGHGQIDFAKIRTFINSLAGYGFQIKVLTADRFQSADTLQIFEKLGWETKFLSVDTTPEPYLYLKQACVDKRILYYNYPILIKEMSELEIDLDKNIVDHPEGGTKDVSDATAGVVFNLMKMKDALKSTQYAYHSVIGGEGGIDNLPPKMLRQDSGAIVIEGEIKVNMDVMADEVIKYLEMNHYNPYVNQSDKEEDG